MLSCLNERALRNSLYFQAVPTLAAVRVDDRNTVYDLDPLNGTAEFGLTPAQEALVIGGEASLWGEEIDASNLQQRAWPRGCAFAERMWSNRDVKSVALAAPRIGRMVCKMKARGIGASPIGPGSCLATQATYIAH